MEEEIVNNLYVTFSGNSDSEIKEAQEKLNVLSQDSQFYSILFNIIQNLDYPAAIRIGSIIQLKKQIQQNWKEKFPIEFKKILLSNFPSLILIIEPQYIKNISDLMKTVVSLSIKDNFFEFWAKVIQEFIVQDEKHCLVSLLLIKATIVHLRSIFIKTYNSNPYLNSQFKPFFDAIIQQIANIYQNANIETKIACLSVIKHLIVIDETLCTTLNGSQLEVNPQFLFWLQSATIISQDLPRNRLSARLLKKFLNLFTKLANYKIKIPFVYELSAISSHLMIADWGDPQINKILITSFFQLISEVSKGPSWDQFMPTFPDIMANVFLPFLQLPNEALEMAENDPSQFVIAYHIDPMNNIYDTPLLAAYSSLKSICDSQFSKTENQQFREFLIKIAADSFSDFLQNGNALKLFSMFQLSTTYFSQIYISNFDTAISFIDNIINTGQQFHPLATSAILNLISTVNPYISDSDQPYLDQSDYFEEEEFSPKDLMEIEAKKRYIRYAISLLDSNSSLVKYFSSYAIYNLINFTTQKKEAQRLEVMKECKQDALKILHIILQYASENGEAANAQILSQFVRDKEMLYQIVNQLPMFVSFFFEVSPDQTQKVFGSLIILLDQLDDFPEMQDASCKLVFQAIIQTFDKFKEEQYAYELINTIVAKAPIFYDEYNAIFPTLLSAVNINLKQTLILGVIAIIFHNLILKSPDFMKTQINNLIEFSKLVDRIDLEDSCALVSGLLYLTTSGDPNLHINKEQLDHILLVLFDKIDLASEEQNYMMGYHADSYIKIADLIKILIKNYPEPLLQYHQQSLLFHYFEEANYLDVGFALAYLENSLPPDFRMKILQNILESPPERHLETSEDNEELDFENTFNSIDMIVLPIFTKEKTLSIFCEYLRNLVQRDSSILNSFGPEFHSNIQQYLSKV